METCEKCGLRFILWINLSTIVMEDDEEFKICNYCIDEFMKDYPLNYKMVQKLCKIHNEYEIPYYSWYDLKVVFWDEYWQFIDWMSGQGSYVEWVFASDVANYFHHRDNWTLDLFPHWF